MYEPKLLGTAGTLLANQKFFESSTGLLIHADNVMVDDMRPFFKRPSQTSTSLFADDVDFQHGYSD